MPKMNIDKSIHINAKLEDVYNKLNDFHHWSAWSPWLVTERTAKVDVDEDGKFYSWEGDRVGSGNMQVLSETPNEINYDLHFLKPWKSHANVGFKFKENGEGTDVTWTMDSSLPFFMFWMKKSMTAFVGMDYERGLRMLKDYIEDGKVHSELDIKGKESFEGCKYIGIKRSCSIDEMGGDMSSQFGELYNFAGDNDITFNGDPFSIYHKWDMVSRKAEYTVAVPVNDVPHKLSGNIISGEIPKTAVHTVKHKGKYEHLGNAWNVQYSMQRGKSFKANKGVDPMEVYRNDPSETPANELVTEILFPTK